MQRRQFLATGSAAAVAAGLAGLPGIAAAEARRFAPAPGAWRTWEMTTRIELAATGPARIWIPLPAVDDSYQRPVGHQWRGNARRAAVVSDGVYGAAMLDAEFNAPGERPTIEVTSVFRTQDRATDWQRPRPVAHLDAATRAFWTAPTELKPTDGIVRETARRITRGSATDVDKVRALYRWVVANAHREPSVAGCGTGDIRVMLETGNLSGKCADLNALFVGLARAVGIPARDVYGVRLAPSAFGYRELGASASGDITKAQHCRAEVYLPEFGGWVAMDPADVLKVMRQETAEWVKDPGHALARPVDAGLFGGWEGNWVAYNHANDVVLPGSGGQRLGFVMYPQALNAKGLFDCLRPETFVYTIRARELRSVA